jgi:hypothetical protein
MTGKDLAAPVADDTPVRDAAIFGYFGYPINVTDGTHLYMHNVQDTSVQTHNYNWMPASMRGRYSLTSFASVDLAEPLPFSKGIPVPRFHAGKGVVPEGWSSKLFNLEEDPGQTVELDDPETEDRMVTHLSRLMREADAPEALFQRFGL